jgi:hypothetical protein
MGRKSTKLLQFVTFLIIHILHVLFGAGAGAASRHVSAKMMRLFVVAPAPQH